MYYDVDKIVEGGKTKFVARIQHKGLGKSRVISGTILSVVDRMAETQIDNWEAAWQIKCRKEKELKQKQDQKAKIEHEKQSEKERKINEAESQTKDAEHAIEEIKNILKFTSTVDDKIDWDSLIDRKEFNKPPPIFNEPTKPVIPPRPSIIPDPDMPRLSDSKYKPNLTVWDTIFQSQKKAKIDLGRDVFKNDYKNWKIESANTKKMNVDRLEKWEEERQLADGYPLSVNQAMEKYNAEYAAWLNEKNEYLLAQEEINKAIKKRKNDYLQKSPDAIIEYCDMVLSNSIYPDFFPQEFDLDYKPETKILIVDYSLPVPNILPSLKDVKFIPTRDKFKSSYIPAGES